MEETQGNEKQKIQNEEEKVGCLVPCENYYPNRDQNKQGFTTIKINLMQDKNQADIMINEDDEKVD